MPRRKGRRRPGSPPGLGTGWLADERLPSVDREYSCKDVQDHECREHHAQHGRGGSGRPAITQGAASTAASIPARAMARAVFGSAKTSATAIVKISGTATMALATRLKAVVSRKVAVADRSARSAVRIEDRAREVTSDRERGLRKLAPAARLSDCHRPCQSRHRQHASERTADHQQWVDPQSSSERGAVTRRSGN